jgi:hypothetical protein
MTRAYAASMPAPRGSARKRSSPAWRPSGITCDGNWRIRETQEALQQLRAAVLARQKAEGELAELYRERAIRRAQAAERDPAAPLQ